MWRWRVEESGSGRRGVSTLARMETERNYAWKIALEAAWWQFMTGSLNLGNRAEGHLMGLLEE
jgi:hypothetical protein